MTNLTLEEMETHLNMTADDRGIWQVESNDPVLQRRLEAAGAELVKVLHGGCKVYTLPANQVTFRKPAKPLSEARKKEMGDRMRALRAAQKIA